MKTIAIMSLSLMLLLAACAAPAPVVRGPVIGDASEARRVMGWRLVERTYGTADAGHAGDGEIPSSSRTLVYAPIFEAPRERVREYGAVRLRSSCEHEVTLSIRGGTHHAVGSAVTAAGRIESPSGLYHELEIARTAPSIELLDVRGAMPVAGRPGRYFIEGAKSFQVVFTSTIAGQGGIEISVAREVGLLPGRREP